MTATSATQLKSTGQLVDEIVAVEKRFQWLSSREKKSQGLSSLDTHVRTLVEATNSLTNKVALGQLSDTEKVDLCRARSYISELKSRRNISFYNSTQEHGISWIFAAIARVFRHLVNGIKFIDLIGTPEPKLDIAQQDLLPKDAATLPWDQQRTKCIDFLNKHIRLLKTTRIPRKLGGSYAGITTPSFSDEIETREICLELSNGNGCRAAIELPTIKGPFLLKDDEGIFSTTYESYPTFELLQQRLNQKGFSFLTPEHATSLNAESHADNFSSFICRIDSSKTTKEVVENELKSLHLSAKQAACKPWKSSDSPPQYFLTARLGDVYKTILLTDVEIRSNEQQKEKITQSLGPVFFGSDLLFPYEFDQTICRTREQFTTDLKNWIGMSAEQCSKTLRLAALFGKEGAMVVDCAPSGREATIYFLDKACIEEVSDRYSNYEPSWQELQKMLKKKIYVDFDRVPGKLVVDDHEYTSAQELLEKTTSIDVKRCPTPTELLELRAQCERFCKETAGKYQLPPGMDLDKVEHLWNEKGRTGGYLCEAKFDRDYSKIIVHISSPILLAPPRERTEYYSYTDLVKLRVISSDGRMMLKKEKGGMEAHPEGLFNSLEDFLQRHHYPEIFTPQQLIDKCSSAPKDPSKV